MTGIDMATEHRPGTVMVTGAASGLGRAVALAVAKAGGTAVGLDRSPCDPADSLDATVLDVTDRAAVTSAIEQVVDRHGSIDAVVTAAGIDACGPLGTVSADQWDQVIAVNLLGTANVVRAALPHLRTTSGRILTIASTLGHRAVGDATAYCASKFGVVGFTRALQAELREDSVSVTLVTPGGMRTPFFDGRDEQYRPGPDAPLLDADDVAAVILGELCRSGPGVREIVIASPAEPSWP